MDCTDRESMARVIGETGKQWLYHRIVDTNAKSGKPANVGCRHSSIAGQYWLSHICPIVDHTKPGRLDVVETRTGPPRRLSH